MTQSVLFETDARGIARVTLNRPDLHNAFNEDMIHRLTELFEGLARQENIRLVLLRGAGKSFSAGGDLDWMRRAASYGREQNLEDARGLARMLKALYDLPMPTIAVVNGAALGGGVGLVAACDIAISIVSASFGLTEVRLGLIPAVISPYVARAIGERAASRYFLTGERFGADTALRLGLLHEITADKDMLDGAVEIIAASLIASGPMAVRDAKMLLRHVAGAPITPSLIETTANRIADRRASEEAGEGLAAFFDKRKPRWADM